MYKIIIGEISKAGRENWYTVEVDEVLESKLFEQDCSIGTLPQAARTFHNEVQLDWGIFAWKAFKSEIKQFFRKRGVPKRELEPFDEFKEYGVVYIDN